MLLERFGRVRWSGPRPYLHGVAHTLVDCFRFSKLSRGDSMYTIQTTESHHRQCACCVCEWCCIYVVERSRERGERVSELRVALATCTTGLLKSPLSLSISMVACCVALRVASCNSTLRVEFCFTNEICWREVRKKFKPSPRVCLLSSALFQQCENVILWFVKRVEYWVSHLSKFSAVLLLICSLSLSLPFYYIE